MALKSLLDQVAVVGGPLRQVETFNGRLDQQRQTSVRLEKSLADEHFRRKMNRFPPRCFRPVQLRLHWFGLVHDSSTTAGTAPTTTLRFADFNFVRLVSSKPAIAFAL